MRGPNISSNVPKIDPICTKHVHVPNMYPKCTQSAPKNVLYQKCTQNVPKLYPMYPKCTQKCTKLYQKCTQNVPKLYPNASKVNHQTHTHTLMHPVPELSGSSFDCHCLIIDNTMERGGFKQRMEQRAKRQAREDSPQGTSSKLASLLLQRWCWGMMSLPLLQRLASSAVQDGLEQPLLR